jgi:hypothetical protein
MGHICLWSLLMILGETRNIIKRNTEAVLDVSSEVGREVNAEKTNYMFMT